MIVCGRPCIRGAVVACGVVYAAACRFQAPLPENQPWWKEFDAEISGSDDVCKVVAHLYSLPKAQYIVCKDGKFSSSNMSSDSQLQPVLKWSMVDCLMMLQVLLLFSENKATSCMHFLSLPRDVPARTTKTLLVSIHCRFTYFVCDPLRGGKEEEISC